MCGYRGVCFQEPAESHGYLALNSSWPKALRTSGQNVWWPDPRTRTQTPWSVSFPTSSTHRLGSDSYGFSSVHAGPATLPTLTLSITQVLRDAQRLEG